LLSYFTLQKANSHDEARQAARFAESLASRQPSVSGMGLEKPVPIRNMFSHKIG
jgi:hypothetical protein